MEGTLLFELETPLLRRSRQRFRRIPALRSHRRSEKTSANPGPKVASAELQWKLRTSLRQSVNLTDHPVDGEENAFHGPV